MSAAAILKLQASGFTADQVTALAELIDTQASTKADVDGVEHRLSNKIEAVEHRLDIKISDVKTNLELKIADVKAEVSILKWMIGFVLAFQLAIFAKLFIH
jgi:hypothetical protein